MSKKLVLNFTADNHEAEVVVGCTRVVGVVMKDRKSSGSVFGVRKSSRGGYQVSQYS